MSRIVKPEGWTVGLPPSGVQELSGLFLGCCSFFFLPVSESLLPPLVGLRRPPRGAWPCFTLTHPTQRASTRETATARRHPRAGPRPLHPRPSPSSYVPADPTGAAHCAAGTAHGEPRGHIQGAVRWSRPSTAHSKLDECRSDELDPPRRRRRGTRPARAPSAQKAGRAGPRGVRMVSCMAWLLPTFGMAILSLVSSLGCLSPVPT